MPDTAFDPFASAAVITMARQGRTPRPLDLPAALRPRNAAEAYAVQDAVVHERGEVAGWKVGAASPQAQPVRAALTNDSVWVDAAGQAVHLPAAGFAVIGVEAEPGVPNSGCRPARPRHSLHRGGGAGCGRIGACRHRGVRHAFCSLGTAGRMEPPGRPGLPRGADCGIGVADVAAVQPLMQGVTLSVNGSVSVRHAAWGNPAGDPLRLLAWLANEGARSLGGLRAGQWVTTGSCSGTVLVAPGTVVVADFPGLGCAGVKFD